MIYLKYTMFVILHLITTLLNFILAPTVVLFSNEEGWLPNWLSWFQTPDNSLDGDEGWKTLHRPYKQPTTYFHNWANRTLWLYRNSMYGFKFSVLGVKHYKTDDLILTGDSKTSNIPGHSGTVKRTLLRRFDTIAWQFYYIRQWGSSDKCIRINLGWKLWSFHKNEGVTQFVFSISPWASFKTFNKIK